MSKATKQLRPSWLAAIALTTALLAGCATRMTARVRGFKRAAPLPGVSGLAWVEDDLFLAVHDAKRSKKQRHRPRVSLIRLPRSAKKGMAWHVPDLEYPGAGGLANDLESAARIPGGRGFLLAESGPRGKHAARIFFAVYEDGTLEIESSVPWPVEIDNVEAIEVARVGGKLVFIYAERAEGLPSTGIRWAPLFLDPLEFGPFRNVTYTGTGPVGKGDRLVSDLAVDGDDVLYSSSAWDRGDDGPFRSVVRRIGKLTAGGDGDPRIDLGEKKRIATLDGLKVEAVVVRESAAGDRELFVGTDDEDYGGIIRLLPPSP